MRNHEKQRVMCTSCGWSGGRKPSANVLDLPCFKCGSPVEKSGEVYLEERVLVGCPSCSWWGETAPDRIGCQCRRCEAGVLESAVVVTKAAGSVLA